MSLSSCRSKRVRAESKVIRKASTTNNSDVVKRPTHNKALVRLHERLVPRNSLAELSTEIDNLQETLMERNGYCPQ